jgi:uncharacterized protein (DUF1697 family)
MTKYLSVLDNINRTEDRAIPMDALRALCRSLDLKNAQTYMEGGNIVFESDEVDAGDKISDAISAAIKEHYKIDVTVITRSLAKMEAVLKANIYAKIHRTDIKSLFVTFLRDVPNEADVERLKNQSFPPDEFDIVDSDVFLHCFGKYETTKLNNAFFEAELGQKAVSRQWKTLTKMIDLAKRIEKEW